MTRPAKVVTWNGKDVPAELRELPAGRYVVEAIDDAPALSPDEEAGIEEGENDHFHIAIIIFKIS